MTQGIGPDGHTVGIMPFPENPARFGELFENETVWVAGYDARGKSQYPLRATVTIPFLRTQVNESIAYVTGSEKQNALKSTLHPASAPSVIPSVIIHKMKHISLFTDIKE